MNIRINFLDDCPSEFLDDVVLHSFKDRNHHGLITFKSCSNDSYYCFIRNSIFSVEINGVLIYPRCL